MQPPKMKFKGNFGQGNARDTILNEDIGNGKKNSEGNTLRSCVTTFIGDFYILSFYKDI
jgi:hypothetical protein